MYRTISFLTHIPDVNNFAPFIYMYTGLVYGMRTLEKLQLEISSS
jgi:hypothetical protein